MSKIEDLLLLSENEPELFIQYVSSVADAIEEPSSSLATQEYTHAEGWIAGYKVSYAYRMAVAKQKDGGEEVYVEVSIFSILNFRKETVYDDMELVEQIKSEIGEKIKRSIM